MPASLMFSSAAISRELRRTAELAREAAHGVLDLVVDPLDPAGLTQQQRVAQVVAHLAFDHRHRVGREAHALARVEALSRLDQPEIGDLEQVFVGFVGGREALEDVMQQPLVVAHDLVETDR